MSPKINAYLDCECAFLAHGRNGYGVSENGGFARQAHGFFEWCDSWKWIRNEYHLCRRLPRMDL